MLGKGEEPASVLSATVVTIYGWGVLVFPVLVHQDCLDSSQLLPAVGRLWKRKK